jgi:WD40 repeat protein
VEHPRDREEAVLAHPNEPHSVAFRRDGGALVTVAATSARVWDLRGQGEALVLSGHDGSVNDVAFRADGRLLASAGVDKVVRLWDAETGRLRATLTGLGASVCSLACHPDGQTLATGDFDGGVRLWDLHSPEAPQELPRLEHDAGSFVWCVRFSPDGKYLAAGGQDGLTVWRAAPARCRPAWQPYRRLKGHHVPDLCFGPGGRWLAWGEHDSGVRLCRLEGWQVTLQPSTLHDAPHALGFLPDGERLLWIDAAYRAAVWEAGTGRKDTLLDLGTAPVVERRSAGRKLALSPDGRWLALHGSSVTIWDTQTRGLVLGLPPEPEAVACLAWGGGRDRLAVGSTNGRLVVWNLPRVRAQLACIGLGW